MANTNTTDVNSSSTNHHQQSPQQKPLLIIHRTPSYAPIFHHRLTTLFTLLDTTSTPTHLSQGVSAQALLCIDQSPLGKVTLDCFPSLKCVVTTCVGVDHIDLTECRRRGIAVANVGDAFSDDVADFALGLLVDVLRKVSVGDRFVRAGSWGHLPEFPLGTSLGGKRVGIVGLGSIGSRVARRLLSFNCLIAYNSRQEKHNVSFPFYANVLDLALESDILILCCSLTDQTHNLINKDVLTALGKEGIVINVGRGSLIDEKELVSSLINGEIGGAGLDVFEDEPNVPKALFGLDNVVMSPHQAVSTPESFQAAEDITVENLEAFFSNKPLLTPVT